MNIKQIITFSIMSLALNSGAQAASYTEFVEQWNNAKPEINDQDTLEDIYNRALSKDIETKLVKIACVQSGNTICDSCEEVTIPNWEGASTAPGCLDTFECSVERQCFNTTKINLTELAYGVVDDRILKLQNFFNIQTPLTYPNMDKSERKDKIAEVERIMAGATLEYLLANLYKYSNTSDLNTRCFHSKQILNRTPKEGFSVIIESHRSLQPIYDDALEKFGSYIESKADCIEPSNGNRQSQIKVLRLTVQNEIVAKFKKFVGFHKKRLSDYLSSLVSVLGVVDGVETRVTDYLKLEDRVIQSTSRVIKTTQDPLNLFHANRDEDGSEPAELVKFMKFDIDEAVAIANNNEYIPDEYLKLNDEDLSLHVREMRRHVEEIQQITQFIEDSQCRSIKDRFDEYVGFKTISEYKQDTEEQELNYDGFLTLYSKCLNLIANKVSIQADKDLLKKKETLDKLSQAVEELSTTMTNDILMRGTHK